MDDGIAHSATAVADTLKPQGQSGVPFTQRQVMILRAMLAVMALTLIGGGAMVVTALVWKLRQAPAMAAAPSPAEWQALAATQPGVQLGELRIPAGARLAGSHIAGDTIVLVYDDVGGTTLVRLDLRSWKLSGVARLSPAAPK